MPQRVDIRKKETVFQRHIFTIDEVHLRHETFGGTMSEEKVRLSFERGDSAAALMHHPTADTLLLVEQFRYPAYAKDGTNAWLLEIPAGIVESDEAPAAAMQREIEEETGYAAQTLHPLFSFFPSPGGSSERIHLFYARLDSAVKVSEGGGVVAEGEELRTVQMPVSEVLDKMRRGEIADGKTLLALQWLQLNRGSLPGAPPPPSSRNGSASVG